MRKIIRIFMVISLVFVLAGCNAKWEDVTKAYGDVLKTNPSCTYKDSENASAVTSLSSIALSANMEGLYVSYNGGSKNDLFTKSGFNNIQYLNEKALNYNDFDFESFIKSYQTYGCPSSIYVCINEYVYISDKKLYDASCYIYSQTSSGGSTPSNPGTEDKPKGIKCQGSNQESFNQNAQSCAHYSKTDKSNRKVSIEIGKEKQTSGTINNYFAISYDGFKSGELDHAGSVMTTKYGDTYLIDDSTVFNIENGKYGGLSIRYATSGFESFYYLYKTGNDITQDGTDLGGANETLPSQPGGDGNSPTTGGKVPDQSITPIGSLCEQQRVLSAFKILGYVLFVLKIVVPLLLMGLAVWDFFRAMISSDDKANKEAISKLIRRAIIAVIIFIIPSVLNYALLLVDGAIETTSKFTDCTTCLLNPKDCKN